MNYYESNEQRKQKLKKNLEAQFRKHGLMVPPSFSLYKYTYIIFKWQESLFSQLLYSYPQSLPIILLLPHDEL